MNTVSADTLARRSNAPAIHTLASRAFDFFDRAGTYKGAAQHEMAYVIRLIHSEFLAGGMPIAPAAQAEDVLRCPAWEAVVKPGQARKDFVKAVKVRLNVQGRPKPEQETDKQRMARQDSNNAERAHEQLIRNSVDFAAALAIRNVPMSDHYNYTAGKESLPMWRVPLGMLLCEGWELKGSFKPSDTRALNGKSLPVHKLTKDGDDYVDVSNAVASIATFKLATFGKADAPQVQANGAGDGANENDAHNPPPVIIAGTTYRASDFNAFVERAAAVVTEWDGVEDCPPLCISDFPEPVRNAWALLAAHYDSAVAADKERAKVREATERASYGVTDDAAAKVA